MSYFPLLFFYRFFSNKVATIREKMRKGKGDCGKDEFFFLEFFFAYGLSRMERGLGNYQNFFPEIFFLGGGVLEMRAKNSWRIFTELFAQN